MAPGVNLTILGYHHKPTYLLKHLKTIAQNKNKNKNSLKFSVSSHLLDIKFKIFDIWLTKMFLLFFFFRVTNKLPYMPHISDTNILTCIKPMYKCIHVCFKGYYDVSKFIKPTGKYKDVFSRISQVLLSFLPQEGDICQFIANFNIPTHHTWFSLQSVHTLSAQINKIGLGIVPNN